MFIEALVIIPIVILLLTKKKDMSKILCFLGGCSYSIYLIHQNIGYVILKALNENVGMSYAISSLCSIFITCMFGIIIHYFIELRCKKIVRKHFAI